MSTQFSAAVAHLQAGRLGEAEQACRQILQQNGADANAWHLLGIVAGQAGKHDMAADLIRKAVALRGDVSVFHSNLGLALMSTGRSDQADVAFREALRLNPDDVESHLRLGALQLQRDAIDDAVELFRTAVRISDGSAVAHHRLAEAYRRRGAMEDAIRHYRQAIQRDPKQATSYNNLAGVLLDRGEFNQAIGCLGDLLRLSPTSERVYNNLGTALQTVGQVEQAVQCYRNAIQLKPDFDLALSNLASLLADAGNLDEALDCYDRLADLNAENPEAIAGKAKVLERQGREEEAGELLRQLPQTPQISVKVGTVCAAVWRETGRKTEAVEILERLLATSATDTRERISIHFSLGNVYDDLGQYDNAFRHYRDGNRLKARSCEFSLEQHGQKVERLIEAFGPRQMDRLARSTVDSQLPVFIVGMPRSGTSLIEQILASHGQVFGGGELPSIQKLLDATHAQPEADLKQPMGSSVGGVRFVEADSDRVRAIPGELETMSVGRLNELAELYLQELRRLADGADVARITDKMPFNFRNLGFIRMLFPNARIIHCRRDALDTCLSCYFQNFLRGNHFTYDLSALGAYYQGYERVIEHWRDAVEVPMLEVQYEQLVADPEHHVRELVAFCGLDWDARCLQFHKSRRIVHTASYQQVRQPIYSKSVGRWKNYQRHLQPLIEALGDTGRASHT